MDTCSDAATRPLIVVVDDAPHARALLSRALTQAGYDVLTAPDGLSAVALIQRHPVLPTLVITDLHMPMLRGEQLAYWLHQHFPRIPVLFMSAFEYESGAALGGHLLRKPFMTDELLAAVTHILGSSGGKDRPRDEPVTSLSATRHG